MKTVPAWWFWSIGAGLTAFLGMISGPLWIWPAEHRSDVAILLDGSTQDVERSALPLYLAQARSEAVLLDALGRLCSNELAGLLEEGGYAAVKSTDLTLAELRERMSFSYERDRKALTLSVRSSRREEAVGMAKALVDSLVAHVRGSLEARREEDRRRQTEKIAAGRKKIEEKTAEIVRIRGALEGESVSADPKAYYEELVRQRDLLDQSIRSASEELEHVRGQGRDGDSEATLKAAFLTSRLERLRSDARGLQEHIQSFWNVQERIHQADSEISRLWSEVRTAEGNVATAVVDPVVNPVQVVQSLTILRSNVGMLIPIFTGVALLVASAVFLFLRARHRSESPISVEQREPSQRSLSPVCPETSPQSLEESCDTTEMIPVVKPAALALDGDTLLGKFPILGRIARARATDQKMLVAESVPRMEQIFQQVGALLQARLTDTASRVVAFVSAERGAGTTTLMANLASVLSRGRAKVLAIDANMRSPALHDLFRITNTIGLSLLLEQKLTVSGSLDDALESDVPKKEQDSPVPRLEIGDLRALQALGINPEEAEENVLTRSGPLDTEFWQKAQRITFPVPLRNLRIIPAGPAPKDPQYLLGTIWMQELVAFARKANDFVFIDCPSLEEASDALVLGSGVDAFVVVVRAGGNENRTLQAIRTVQAACGKVTGILVTHSEACEEVNENTIPERRDVERS